MKNSKILLFLIIVISGMLLIPLSCYAATSIYDSNIEIKVDNKTYVYSDVSYTYSGSVQKPTISIIHKKAGIWGTNKTLKLNKDYQLLYTNSNSTNAGTYKITITGKGSYSGTKSIAYSIKQRDISTAKVTLTNGSTYNYTGNKMTPSFTIKYNNKNLTNKDYTLANSNNTLPGTGYIIFSGMGNFSGRVEKTYTIKGSIKNAEVILDKAEYAYTGSDIKPNVTVKFAGKTLENNTDYTINYSNNKNAGTGKITIKGKGCYKETIEKTFKIKAIPISNATIILNDGKGNILDYTGKEIKPKVVLKYSNKTIPISDYSITYSNNKNIGTGKVTIKAKEKNCTGIATKEFNIKYNFSKTVKVTLDSTEFTYTGSKIYATVTVMHGNKKLTRNTDYTLVYTNITNVGTAKVTITGMGKYNGKIEKTYKINKCSIKDTNIKLNKTSFDYNGSKIEPKVTIKYKEKELRLNTDYTVKYNNNIDSGNAEVIIKGQGNYKGEKKITYIIKPISLESAKITLDKAVYEYSGKAIKPVITVKTANGVTISSKNYEISYLDNKNVGTGTITITGIQNCIDSNSIKFEIKYPIKRSTLKMTTKYTYTGSPIKPTDISVIYNKKTLINGKDYKVLYSRSKLTKTITDKNDITNVGTCEIKIIGKGNYTGTIKKEYTINTLSIKNNKDIEIQVKDAIYTGSSVKPKVIVKHKNRVLESNEYTISYSNNINVGKETGKVIIEGKENFKDSKSETFSINKREISNVDIDWGNTAFSYTGKPVDIKISVKHNKKKLKLGKDYAIIYQDSNGVPCLLEHLINYGEYKITIKGMGKNYTGEISKDYIIRANIKNAKIKIGTKSSNGKFTEKNKFTYEGNEIIPDVIVKYNNKELILDKDYRIVECENNLNANDSTKAKKSTIIIEGINSFEGKYRKNFTITKCPIDDSDINIGLSSEGKLLIKYKKITLVEDKDFEANCKTNDIFKKTFEIEGINNFEGNTTKTLETVIDYEEKFKYTGKEIMPSVTLYQQGKVLDSKYYKVSYKNNIKVGNKAEIIITSKTGVVNKGVKEYPSKTVYFTIEKTPVQDIAKIKLVEDRNYIYDGENPVRPEIEIISDENFNEYEIFYKNNEGVGTGTVGIYGIEGYTGSLKIEFNIIKGSKSSNMNIPKIYQDLIDYNVGNASISADGCGIVSYAMVLSYLCNETIEPQDLAELYYGKYFFGGKNGGTNGDIFKNTATDYGIKFYGEHHSWDNKKDIMKSEILSALREGKPVIAKYDKGIFTNVGHYIVFTGVKEYQDENGNNEIRILVNDPLYANDPNNVDEYNHRSSDKNGDIRREGYVRGFDINKLLTGNYGAATYYILGK